MFVSLPAVAQQQQSPVLDTLNRALGAPQPRSATDDYRRASSEDERLPRDSQGHVDIRRLDDRDLMEYRDRLNRRGRYIASELRDTEDEIQHRGLERRR